MLFVSGLLIAVSCSNNNSEDLSIQPGVYMPLNVSEMKARKIRSKATWNQNLVKAGRMNAMSGTDKNGVETSRRVFELLTISQDLELISFSYKELPTLQKVDGTGESIELNKGTAEWLFQYAKNKDGIYKESEQKLSVFKMIDGELSLNQLGSDSSNSLDQSAVVARHSAGVIKVSYFQAGTSIENANHIYFKRISNVSKKLMEQEYSELYKAGKIALEKMEVEKISKAVSSNPTTDVVELEESGPSNDESVGDQNQQSKEGSIEILEGSPE